MPWNRYQPHSRLQESLADTHTSTCTSAHQQACPKAKSTGSLQKNNWRSVIAAHYEWKKDFLQLEQWLFPTRKTRQCVLLQMLHGLKVRLVLHFGTNSLKNKLPSKGMWRKILLGLRNLSIWVFGANFSSSTDVFFFLLQQSLHWCSRPTRLPPKWPSSYHLLFSSTGKQQQKKSRETQQTIIVNKRRKIPHAYGVLAKR